MRFLCLAIGIALAVAGPGGCGTSPSPGLPPTAKVKGTVSLDGKSVPTGAIQFGQPGVPSQGLEIKNGAFAGEVPVGKAQVEVFIYAEGPASEKYGGAKSKTNIAPQKYWGTNTTLSADIKPGDANEFKFDLTAK
jgi:hypothetical protein